MHTFKHTVRRTYIRHTCMRAKMDYAYTHANKQTYMTDIQKVTFITYINPYIHTCTHMHTVSVIHALIHFPN
jgi:hypothetical protein